jgi:hypothetical protein
MSAVPTRWQLQHYHVEPYRVVVAHQPRAVCHRNSTPIGSPTTRPANRYLEQVFIPDFNRRLTVKPAQPDGAFVRLLGVELELVLSAHHDGAERRSLRKHLGANAARAAGDDKAVSNHEST